MSDVEIGDGTSRRLAAHGLRADVLAEVHARPFTAVRTPARILHFAFDTSGGRGDKARAALAEFCETHKLPAPKQSDRYWRATIGDTVFRWEAHSEFTTYQWEFASKSDGISAFQPPAAKLAQLMGLFPQPGPLLVALDLHIILDRDSRIAPESCFDPDSVTVAATNDDRAIIATDFQTDAGGFVRILVLDRGLSPEQAGALVQRLLELETYRTFALLGLFEAQRLGPSITRIERRLAALTAEMQSTEGFEANHRLLDELTALAAELEAGAAASLFRFGASRAYYEIVQARLETIDERPVSQYPTWSSFLARRMAPAMRTCMTTEERQANLSRKLARAAQLLRTRVDIELQQQNRDLLTSMNERTRLQLRLQRTVEGLSVAAISYYVVGLFGYVVKGAKDAGAPVDPSLATAAFVPVAVLIMWWVVRRIRRHVAAAD